MKKILLLTGIFLVLFLRSQTSLPLSGYHQQTSWLEEKEGNYGLRTETQTLIPYAYDLVLPTLQEEFAFIVKGLKIGVYDIKGGKEIELTSNFNELQIYPGKDGAYYLLYNSQSYGHQQTKNSKKLIRDALGKIKIIEGGKLDVTVGDSNYQNGILRIDSLHFLHHFTKLDWIKNYGGQDGEEQVTYSYTSLLQRSGVFSLEKKDFIIPAQFSEIDVALSDYYSSYCSRYIQVKKAKNDASFIEVNKSQTLNDLDDIYQYGLYSSNYKLVQAPQKSPLHLAINGGFYKYDQQLEVYDRGGIKIISFNDSIQLPINLIRMKDRCYLGYNSSNMGELEMSIYRYEVYNLKKELIKKTAFSFLSYLKDESIALVSTTNHPDSFNLLYGAYNLETSTFLIPSIYEKIDQVQYKNSLLECDSGKCDYYYVCTKNKTLFYFDRNFKPFQPKNVILEIADLNSLKNDEFAPLLGPQINAIEKTDKKIKPFIDAGIKIDVSFYAYFDPNYFEERYYGQIVATYKGLNILKAYHSPKEKPTYGLYYQNHDDFILEPFFDKIEFDLKNKALKITYHNKSNSLLLERYFDEN